MDDLHKAALEILGRNLWELKRQTFRVTLIYGPGRWLELLTTIRWLHQDCVLLLKMGMYHLVMLHFLRLTDKPSLEP